MKHQSKYVKSAIVCAVILFGLYISKSLFLLPAYSLVGSDEKNIDAQLHSIETNMRLLNIAIIVVSIVLVVSLLLEALRARNKKS